MRGRIERDKIVSTVDGSLLSHGTEEHGQIPPLTLVEVGLPVEALFQLASREGNSKKPIYELHKWWARRLGHIFRFLLIAATTPANEDGSTDEAWSKLIRQFYLRNDLSRFTILDPFMGGGTSVVEALKCGARVIGVDVDPMAWFITKKEVEPFNQAGVEIALKDIGDEVEAELRSLYQTREPDGNISETVNVFWVSRIQCGSCRRKFDAHPHYRLSYTTKDRRQVVFCRECDTVHDIALRYKRFPCVACGSITDIFAGTVRRGKYTCPHCDYASSVQTSAADDCPLPKRMFAVEYTISGDLNNHGKPARRYRAATVADRRNYRKAAALLRSERAALWYPQSMIFREGRSDSRPISHGYSRYDQLFNDRQLYCLARIYDAILRTADHLAKEYLLLAFSDCLASNNQLVSYAFGYQKATPLFAIHAFQVPQRPVEGNVWGNPNLGRGSFSRCIKKLITGKQYAQKPYEYRYDSGAAEQVFTGEVISTEVASSPHDWIESSTTRACLMRRSSIDLSCIPDCSVDVVLTDPPFYNNLPYSELSDFYYQWLREYLDGQLKEVSSSTPVSDSFFVSSRNLEQHERYVQGLRKAFAECHRVLKPNGILVFTFHHKDPAAWQALATALSYAEFLVTGISPVRAEGVSGFHSYDGTPKWDAVISCRRNAPLARFTLGESFGEGIVAELRRWTERLQKSEITWSQADRASYAFSLTLGHIVNERVDEASAKKLLLATARLYPQQGISNSMPIPGKTLKYLPRPVLGSQET
jgi:putative DNA methylase